ncbi:hypothetical protein JG687_00018208 [Phytophthora cactorum]|uniref:Uncharacterized protein n=1 Tax=Phytophthora cactorum TaxID=29920 RepID=A0A8T1TN53_9STRA|nr:hypothetical protein JG687_00018208 [Phytophthora cactorum]
MSHLKPVSFKTLKADMQKVAKNVGVLIEKEMGNFFGVMWIGWSHSSVHYVAIYGVCIVKGNQIMVLRYKRIRDDVRQVEAVEEHVPTGAAHKKLMGRLEHLKKLDSVCKTLQDEGTSMAGVSLLFDQVTDDYLAMASYLQTNAKIVHTPVFEAVLVKIANDSKLTTAEARAVERFVVEPSTSTGKKKERSLASASASVELPIRQSSLAAAHVDVVREEDVEDVRLGGWQEPRVLQVSEVTAGQVAVGEADGGTAGQEGVAGRGSRVVCEEVVEGAQLDELRARPVQKVCGIR